MKNTRIALGIISVLAFITVVSPEGLKVQPEGLLVENVPPGAEFDVWQSAGIMLEIFNNDNKEHAYSVTSKTPSQAGFSVMDGYLEIPDPSWLHYSENEVSIPGNSFASVKMFISIPDEGKYLGKKWEVITVVESKSIDGNKFALSAFPKILIATPKLNNSAKFKIRDTSGNPVIGADVRLGSELYITDPNGELDLKDFAIGTYTIKVSKGGYYDASMDIPVRNKENIYEITIDKKSDKTSTLWLYIVIVIITLVVLGIRLLRRDKR